MMGFLDMTSGLKLVAEVPFECLPGRKDTFAHGKRISHKADWKSGCSMLICYILTPPNWPLVACGLSDYHCLPKQRKLYQYL